MSFGVSYLKKDFQSRFYESSQSTPFEDWRARGSKLDAVFRYSHCCEEGYHARYYFMPGYKFGYIESYSDHFADFKVWFEMSFDDERKIVHIERLFCERNDENNKVESGTVGFYMENVEEDYENEIDMFLFKRYFWGSDSFWGQESEWTMAPINLMQPKVRPDYLELVARCKMAYIDNEDIYRVHGVYGIYPIEREEEAATIIQKMYRGWRTRMKHAFNPNTPIGNLLILREFSKATNE